MRNFHFFFFSFFLSFFLNLFIPPQFISNSIDHAKTWKILRPIILDIIKAIVFPLLCFSDEDQELWEEDPYEYVRVKYSIFYIPFFFSLSLYWPFIL